MRKLRVLVALLFVSVQASTLAQAPGAATNLRLSTAGPLITVAIFATSATNPNVDTPLSTAQIHASCGFTFVEETPPITNPTVLFFRSPDGSSTECRVGITALVSALSNGTYKAAYKATSVFTSFSTNFTKS